MRALALLPVLLLPSCAIIAPIFGLDAPQAELTPYQSAMADFSLCETAPNPADRAAAASRLAQVAGAMQADLQPTNADHFYEMDRVVAANARCQEVLGQ